MQGDKKIIALLNRVLTNELTAINQYFLHARMHRNWGFERLNDRIYHRSIKTMKEADDLIERVLFLEGLPNLQNLGKLSIGENAIEAIEADLKFEATVHRPLLVEGIVACETAADFQSRELLEDLLEHCEEHLDWLETQRSLIATVGMENYLQAQIEPGD